MHDAIIFVFSPKSASEKFALNLCLINVNELRKDDNLRKSNKSDTNMDIDIDVSDKVDVNALRAATNKPVVQEVKSHAEVITQMKDLI